MGKSFGSQPPTWVLAKYGCKAQETIMEGKEDAAVSQVSTTKSFAATYCYGNAHCQWSRVSAIWFSTTHRRRTKAQAQSSFVHPTRTSPVDITKTLQSPRIVEFLVINHINKTKKVSLPDPTNKQRSVEVEIEQEAIRFDGNTTPTFTHQLLSRNALVWPTSPNYPAVDCFVWHRKLKTWWAIQITISNHDMKYDDAQQTELKKNTKDSTTQVGERQNVVFVWLGLDPALATAHKASNIDQRFKPLADFAFLRGCGVKGLE